MSQISQSPFEWVQFDEHGALLTPSAVANLTTALGSNGASDLVIISHGWKTDETGAEQLYEPLWGNVTSSLVATGTLDPTKIVVGGVLWPSLQFQQDFDAKDMQRVGTGGTLDLSGATAIQDLDDATFNSVVDGFVALVGSAGEPVRSAAIANQDGFTDASAKELLTALHGAVGLATAALDLELADDANRLSGDPLTTLEKLEGPPRLEVDPSAGGTLSLISALQGALAGPKAAVARLLNQFTYFEMKNRAGIVGAQLGGTFLPLVRPASPVRLHLIGHSFGARLATAAVCSFNNQADLQLRSLTMLQGAFSHNALAANLSGGKAGAFATVLSARKVDGPISITHTHNDSACTIAYALASRLSNDTTQAIGDANDPFGAMGANGAQNLEATAVCNAGPLVPGQARYGLNAKLVNNVLGDACIGEHMDVTNRDVGALVASVLSIAAAAS